ncbi:MAG: FAD-dependent oxidoreductase [Cyanobacteria bacterium J06621_11]
MSADYDLVILGGTLEGRFAASLAAGYGARVALIEPPGVFEQRQQVRYLLKGLQQLAAGRERQAVDAWFRRSESACESAFESVFDFVGADVDELDWAALVNWSAIASKTQLLNLSPDALSARGVDFILSTPDALSRQLVVTAGKRTLTTRAVLAAFGTVPRAEPRTNSRTDPRTEVSTDLAVPLITGIESLLMCDRLPKEISIWGDSFEAVDWAEALNAVGVRVTLVADRFLRDEDSDVREVVRSQLLTAGIRLISSTQRSASSQDSSTVLQLGRHKPALVLPDFVYPPVNRYQGIDARIPERPYLLSNSRLQTAHPRVFACGSLLRRRAFPFTVAKHEAQTAVRNALFLPTRRTNYNKIVQAYARFAKVGKTPKFSREGRPPIVGGYSMLSASSPNSGDLSRVSPMPSYCKIICKKNRVQSIHVLGTDAETVVVTFASMVGRPVTELLSAAEAVTGPLTVENLAALVRSAVFDGMGDGGATALKSRWQPTHWRRDWAENWFNWRRSR